MLRSRIAASRNPFLVLAALTVGLVLLRPACELWMAHAGAIGGTAQAEAAIAVPSASHGDADPQCCASVSDPGSDAPLLAVAGGFESPQLGLGALGVAFVAGSIVALRLTPQRGPPRSVPSFHLRSARILR